MYSTHGVQCSTVQYNTTQTSYIHDDGPVWSKHDVEFTGQGLNVIQATSREAAVTTELHSYIT
jgi:xanthine dehydrogenase molybdopterin-binding subunit B